MNAKWKVGLGMLAGAAVGAGAIELLHAQAKPPAYFVAEIQTIDQEALRPYGAAAPGTIAANGGKFLVRGGTLIPVEGEAPKGRIVVIGFDSLDKAQGWYKSADYQKILPIRLKNTNSRAYIVEGRIRPCSVIPMRRMG